MFASDDEMDRILRAEYQNLLPDNFAERMAAIAFESKPNVFDLLLRFSPKVSVGIGAAAVALAVVGFVGQGPDVLEAIRLSGLLADFLPGM